MLPNLSSLARTAGGGPEQQESAGALALRQVLIQHLDKEFRQENTTLRVDVQYRNSNPPTLTVTVEAAPGSLSEVFGNICSDENPRPPEPWDTVWHANNPQVSESVRERVANAVLKMLKLTEKWDMTENMMIDVRRPHWSTSNVVIELKGSPATKASTLLAEKHSLDNFVIDFMNVFFGIEEKRSYDIEVKPPLRLKEFDRFDGMSLTGNPAAIAKEAWENSRKQISFLASYEVSVQKTYNVIPNKAIKDMLAQLYANGFL